MTHESSTSLVTPSSLRMVDMTEQDYDDTTHPETLADSMEINLDFTQYDHYHKED